MTKPTQEYLQQNLKYDKDTGRLYWLISKRGRQIGKPIGVIRSDGRRELMLDGQRYLTAHVIWALHKGYWVEKPIELDHRDQHNSNDCIENLREATHSQNNHNKYTGNKVRGVYKRGSRYRAMIKVNKKSIHLGYYDTEYEAKLAYDNAAEEHFGEFACQL